MMNTTKFLTLGLIAALGACGGSSDSKTTAAEGKRPSRHRNRPAIENEVIATATRVDADGTVYSAASLRGTDSATGRPIAARAYDVLHTDGSETIGAYAIEPGY